MWGSQISDRLPYDRGVEEEVAPSATPFVPDDLDHQALQLVVSHQKEVWQSV
jgi:hypothetical protein